MKNQRTPDSSLITGMLSGFAALLAKKTNFFEFFFLP
jgi:hypothetical protein